MVDQQSQKILPNEETAITTLYCARYEFPAWESRVVFPRKARADQMAPSSETHIQRLILVSWFYGCYRKINQGIITLPQM